MLEWGRKVREEEEQEEGWLSGRRKALSKEPSPGCLGAGCPVLM